MEIDERGHGSDVQIQVSVMYMILQGIRNSNLYMGGILVLSTIDSRQLHPVRCRLPLL